MPQGEYWQGGMDVARMVAVVPGFVKHALSLLPQHEQQLCHKQILRAFIDSQSCSNANFPLRECSDTIITFLQADGPAWLKWSNHLGSPTIELLRLKMMELLEQNKLSTSDPTSITLKWLNDQPDEYYPLPESDDNPHARSRHQTFPRESARSKTSPVAASKRLPVQPSLPPPRNGVEHSMLQNSRHPSDRQNESEKLNSGAARPSQHATAYKTHSEHGKGVREEAGDAEGGETDKRQSKRKSEKGALQESRRNRPPSPAGGSNREEGQRKDKTKKSETKSTKSTKGKRQAIQAAADDVIQAVTDDASGSRKKQKQVPEIPPSRENASSTHKATKDKIGGTRVLRKRPLRSP